MFQLLFQRNFGSLNVAQFVTVFNDNALKQCFLLITVKQAMEGSGVGYEEQALATILFSIPFLLFSGFAGRFCDWISKRTVVVGAKFSEVLIMGLATYGFWIEHRYMLLVALLLLATQSTFFSPAKYGILPELLPRSKLSAANGLLQTTSYVAILIGTGFAGIMVEQPPSNRLWIGVVLLFTAAGGWGMSMLLDDPEPADPNKFLFNGYPLVDELSSITWVVRQRYLFVSIIGYSFIWMVGTVLLFNINVYGMDTLNLGGTATSVLILFLAIGLGGGCTTAGWVSGERIEAGLVPIGAIGMGGALLFFVLEPETMATTAAVLMSAGFFGGFFLIPLQTLMQELPAAGRKGEALGIANIFTFLGMIASSVLYVLAVGTFGMTASQLMVCLGGFTLLAGGLIMYLVPRFLVRFLLFLLHLTVVRSYVQGEERVPGTGGVLLVAENVPAHAPIFIDYVLDRPVHFICVDQPETGSWIMSFVIGFMDVTELSSSDPEIRSIISGRLEEAMERGGVLCILTGQESDSRSWSVREVIGESSIGEDGSLKVTVKERPSEGKRKGEEDEAGAASSPHVLVQFERGD